LLRKPFKVGEPVIFTKSKYGLHPGPRAREVMPAPHGDTYAYQVDKFWIVESKDELGRLVLRTRRGKQHVVAADDERLRRPTLWERLRYRARFPEPPFGAAGGQGQAG
jgi:hypothetical protein